MKYIKDNHIIEPNTGSITIDGRMILNPSIHVLIEAGYKKYEAPIIEKTLDDVKEEKIKELREYDKSEAVNQFYYGDIADWVQLELRNNIKNNSIPSQEDEGMTEMYVSLGKVAGVFPIDIIKEMLQALENYAYKCWVVTDKHVRAISQLESIEEVANYDYKTGYPEKIRFEAL